MSEQEQTTGIPSLPWELVLRNSSAFFEPQPDGGMVMALCPVAVQRGEVRGLPPMVKVRYTRDGWERFQAQVAADGGRSRIALARALPPDPPAR